MKSASPILFASALFFFGALAHGAQPDPATLEPAVDTSAAPSTAPASPTPAPPRPAAKPDAAKPDGAKPDAVAPAAAPAPRETPATPPRTGNTPAPGGRARDRLELETTQITGNRELPRVMYVVPWKKSDLGDLGGRPANSLLDEVLTPVDRDVFQRQNRYYDALKPDAADAGAAAPVN